MGIECHAKSCTAVKHSQESTSNLLKLGTKIQDGKPCIPATTQASWAEDHMDDEAERAALKRCTKQVFKIYGISVNNPKLPHAIPPSEASEHAHFDLGSPVSVGLAPSAAVPASPCSMQQPATHDWEAGAAAAADSEVPAPSGPSCHGQAPPSTNGNIIATVHHAAAAATAPGIKEESRPLGRDLPGSAQCSTHSQHVQHMASAPAVTAGAKVGGKRSRDELQASSHTSAPTASSTSSSDSDSQSDSDDDADGIRPARAAEVQRSPEDELWDRFFEEDCRPQHQRPVKHSRTVSPTVASEIPGSGDLCSQQGPSAADSFRGLQGSTQTAPEASTAQAHAAPADANACGQALPSQPEQLALQHEPSVHGQEPLPAFDGNLPLACTTGSWLEPARQPSRCLGTKGCRDPGGAVASGPAASAVQPSPADTTLSSVTG